MLSILMKVARGGILADKIDVGADRSVVGATTEHQQDGDRLPRTQRRWQEVPRLLAS